MVVRVPPSFDPSSSSYSSEAWEIVSRETAPALSNRTMFVSNPTSSQLGGLSVGVPGGIRGLAEAELERGRPFRCRLARELEVGKQLAKVIDYQ